MRVRSWLTIGLTLSGPVFAQVPMGGCAGTVANGLSASGTTQANAYVLTASASEFSSVATGTGALLPVVQIGSAVTIYNDGANPLSVYPQNGGQIGTGSINAPFLIAPGSMASFRQMTAMTWNAMFSSFQ